MGLSIGKLQNSDLNGGMTEGVLSSSAARKSTGLDTVDVFEQDLKNPFSDHVPFLEPADPNTQRERWARRDMARNKWMSRSAPEASAAMVKGMQYLRANMPVEAEVWLQKAVAADNGLLPAHVYLSDAMRMNDGANEAIFRLPMAGLMGWSGPDNDLALGLSYWQTDCKNKVLWEFDSAIKQAPNHPMPLFLRGAFHASNGSGECALADLQAAAAVSQGRGELLMYSSYVKSCVARGVNCGIDPRKVPSCIDV